MFVRSGAVERFFFGSHRFGECSEGTEVTVGSPVVGHFRSGHDGLWFSQPLFDVVSLEALNGDAEVWRGEVVVERRCGLFGGCSIFAPAAILVVFISVSTFVAVSFLLRIGVFVPGIVAVFIASVFIAGFIVAFIRPHECVEFLLFDLEDFLEFSPVAERVAFEALKILDDFLSSRKIEIGNVSAIGKGRERIVDGGIAIAQESQIVIGSSEREGEIIASHRGVRRLARRVQAILADEFGDCFAFLPFVFGEEEIADRFGGCGFGEGVCLCGHLPVGFGGIECLVVGVGIGGPCLGIDWLQMICNSLGVVFGRTGEEIDNILLLLIRQIEAWHPDFQPWTQHFNIAEERKEPVVARLGAVADDSRRCVDHAFFGCGVI